MAGSTLPNSVPATPAPPNADVGNASAVSLRAMKAAAYPTLRAQQERGLPVILAVLTSDTAKQGYMAIVCV
jgi:hypothetical protein